MALPAEQAHQGRQHQQSHDPSASRHDRSPQRNRSFQAGKAPANGSAVAS
jgi:hypothetical protein